MSISFRDYVLISEAFEAIQLEEGKLEDIWAFVKKKLGGKASEEQIEKEIERLKLLDKKDVEKIKKSSASRDFHARKAAEAGKPKPAIRTTQPTVSHHSGVEDAKARLRAASEMGRERAGQKRHAERDWVGEEKLDEAQDFVVTYKLKTGDVAKRWKTTARDAAAAKRKFGDTHYGAKLISVEPVKGGSKVPVKKPKEDSVDSTDE